MPPEKRLFALPAYGILWLAMSEFKFACPVCGQHITADSSASGSQLDCPTCFRKIIVPQATSTESKFVLSASEANKRRSSTTIHTIPQQVRPPKRRIKVLPIITGLLLGLICVGALAFLLLREKSDAASDAGSETNSIAGMARQMPSGTVDWTLNLGEAEFPAETAFGKIAGRDFVCDRAVLQGGALQMRMGKEWPPELGMTVFLYAREASDLSGKSAVVNTNNIRSPRVVIRWREGSTNRTETFTNNFAMKLEFGAMKGSRMPGKIYICLPDAARSCVAGVFNAEIRRPAPPRQPGATNNAN